MWGLIAEYFDEYCEEWIASSSAWGFIGDDWVDSGLDIHLMEDVVERYYKAHMDLTRKGLITLH